jgi:hypothetical protein
MTTDIFFYLQNRRIQTSQTRGQRYSDTFPFSIPCSDLSVLALASLGGATADRNYPILCRVIVVVVAGIFGVHGNDATTLDIMTFNIMVNKMRHSA